VETTLSSAAFTIHVFIHNTTPYTLNVELLHCHLFHEGILIGEAYVANEIILPCDQTCALARVILLPDVTDKSKESVISLFNKYVCGKKSEVEIRLHEKSIPAMPHLSKILSRNYSVTVVLPKLSPDQNSNDVLEPTPGGKPTTRQTISYHTMVKSDLLIKDSSPLSFTLLRCTS
jgi:hypothetical protein